MKRARDENTETKDRLSDLHDCILLHILSFLASKTAVQTCILSRRWKYLWKHLPTLELNSFNFSYFKDFTKFVTRILSLRDDSTTLDTLHFFRDGVLQPPLLKRLIKYAISHNVHHLQIAVQCDIRHFPSALFSSHTLTSLQLLQPHFRGTIQSFPHSLNLPSLTKLCLHWFAFPVGRDGRAEPFSALHKLNTLIIDSCDVHNLCILSTSLVRLTILIRDYPPEDCGEIELSTPNLRIFNYIGSPFHKLYGTKTNLSSIQHIDIDVKFMPNSAEYSLFLLNWLIALVNVKSMTVSSPTLKVLSLVPDIFKIHLPCLCNLKLLKVRKKYSPSIPHLIVVFLLQNSPSTKVKIIEVDVTLFEERYVGW